MEQSTQLGNEVLQYFNPINEKILRRINELSFWGQGFGKGDMLAQAAIARNKVEIEKLEEIKSELPDLINNYSKLVEENERQREALEAIEARLNGEWDNPSLLKFGDLSDSNSDVLYYAQTGLNKRKDD